MGLFEYVRQFDVARFYEQKGILYKFHLISSNLFWARLYENRHSVETNTDLFMKTEEHLMSKNIKCGKHVFSSSFKKYPIYHSLKLAIIFSNKVSDTLRGILELILYPHAYMICHTLNMLTVGVMAHYFRCVNFK